MSLYDFWTSWFNQPAEIKQQFLRKPGMGGYYPPFSETPGYTGNKDPKEYFHFRTSHFGMCPKTHEAFVRCYLEATGWLADRGLNELIFSPDLCVLRILHYFPTDTGAVGEAHRDFNLITVSLPGTEPGLEIMQDGQFVSQEEGIHAGEMLEIYTDGKIPALTHRVNTAPNTERYKAVFFYLPPSELELRPGYSANDYLKNVLSRAGTMNIGAAK